MQRTREVIAVMFVFGLLSGFIIGALTAIVGRLQSDVDNAGRDGDRR